MKQQTTAAANGNLFIWNEYERKIRAAQELILRRREEVREAEEELSESEENLNWHMAYLERAIKEERALKEELVRRLKLFS